MREGRIYSIHLRSSCSESQTARTASSHHHQTATLLLLYSAAATTGDEIIPRKQTPTPASNVLWSSKTPTELESPTATARPATCQAGDIHVGVPRARWEAQKEHQQKHIFSSGLSINVFPKWSKKTQPHGGRSGTTRTPCKFHIHIFFQNYLAWAWAIWWIHLLPSILRDTRMSSQFFIVSNVGRTYFGDGVYQNV